MARLSCRHRAVLNAPQLFELWTNRRAALDRETLRTTKNHNPDEEMFPQAFMTLNVFRSAAVLILFGESLKV